MKGNQYTPTVMTKNFVHLSYHIFVLLLSAAIALSIPHVFSTLSRWHDPQIPEYDLDTDELVFRDSAGRELAREQLLWPAAADTPGHFAAEPFARASRTLRESSSLEKGF